jgi:Flp pilus assembly pilin Flp
MSRLFPSISRLLASEDGPRSIESAVMLTLTLVGCLAIVITIGHSIGGTFSALTSSLSTGS